MTMTDEQGGVLAAERERQKGWADRGLPDPVAVLAAESAARRLYGTDAAHPDRAALDQFFADNPDIDPPADWAD